MAEPRLSWPQSCDVLEARGVVFVERENWPERAGELGDPCPGQGHRGPQLHEKRFEEVELENLTLPRTLMVGCRFHGVSFRNSDFRLSCLAGCEFVDCEFSDADLTCANLRNCTFFACRFVRARLIGVDLLGATLEHGEYTDADLTGARMDFALKGSLPLSETQRRIMVDWRCADDDGPDDESETQDD